MFQRELPFILFAVVLLLPTVPGISLTGVGPEDRSAIPEAEIGEILETGLVEKLASGPRGIIVHFERSPVDLAEIPGIQPSYTFESIPAAYVLAEAEGLRNLAETPGIRFVEDAWKPLAFHLDSATVASRAREVFDPTFEPSSLAIDEEDPTPTLPDGTTIDGAGIGIALVDSGVDGTHAALQGPDKLPASYIATPAGIVEASLYTEHASSHGTHMAGTAAGNGAGDDENDRRGSAPGASIVSFATWVPDPLITTVGSTIAPAMAFDWIIEHGQELDPKIRIVLNGWSCRDAACHRINPDQAHIQLASQLVEEGYVVVFPVGNSGGEGFVNQVSQEASIPTPGVLGVGAHDDEEFGTRTDCTKSLSSRGLATDPATWPDLLAPGDTVWSPQAVAPSTDTRIPVPDNPTPQGDRRAYTPATGTSVAAAHTAGVVALILQANPSLSPAEVEYVLEATAHQLPLTCAPALQADTTHPWNTANWASGHGLLDAVDAVQLALDFDGIPALVPVDPVPEDILDHETAVTAIERTFYLGTGDELTEQRPPIGIPTVHAATIGDTVVHTSKPLENGFTTSGLLVDLWLGSTGEIFASFNGPHIQVHVERLSQDGEAEDVVIDDTGLMTGRFSPLPYHRVMRIHLDDPATFEPGDRIRLTTEMIMTRDAELGPVIGNMVLYAGAHPMPSRIQFGQTTDDVRPGTTEACLSESNCQPFGGDLQYASVDCEGADAHHLVWTGPPGSRATVECNASSATCKIPSDLEAEVGTCMAESDLRSQSGGWGTCMYTTADGTRGGYGECRIGHAPVQRT